MCWTGRAEGGHETSAQDNARNRSRFWGVINNNNNIVNLIIETFFEKDVWQEDK